MHARNRPPFILPGHARFGRVKSLEIDAQQLADLFKPRRGRAYLFSGMPADAQVVDVLRVALPFGKVTLIIESQTFDEVNLDSGSLPQLDIEVATVELREAADAE